MFESLEPMTTRPPAMAAEDFTGPAVLKDQSSFNPPGRREDEAPDRVGPPRNIGQLSADRAVNPARSNSTTVSCALFIQGTSRFHTMARRQGFIKQIILTRIIGWGGLGVARRRGRKRFHVTNVTKI